MVRKLMLVAGIAALSMSATACKTVKGAGQDIQSVGEAGSDALGNR
jgi:predicted small secreted protein